MRTTITLDPDVAAEIERLRKHGDRPYKSLVNDLLRAGLRRAEEPRGTPGGPYTRPRSLGATRVPDVDDVSEALALAEGDHHR